MLSTKSFFILFVFYFAILCPPSFSMNNNNLLKEEDDNAFKAMKFHLNEELEAYTDYVEDAVKYYENLIDSFNLIGSEEKVTDRNFKIKEKLLFRKLEKISVYDKNYILNQYEEL